MFHNLIQPNPTINFNALVSALFPDGVPAPTDPHTDEYSDLSDQILQTVEGGGLTYGDNTWYCDVWAFLSIMDCYEWNNPDIQKIYDVIRELADAGKIHLIDLSD